jgi:competence protein ComEA
MSDDGLAAPPRPPAPPARRLASLSESVAAWRDDPRVGALAIAVVAVLAGVVWYTARSTSSAPEPPTAGAATAPPAPTTSRPTSTTAAAVVVHVAGAVNRPGVVTLRSGERVVDAVQAAGGAVADADLDRLNLAAVVADGQRILVARRGDPPTPALPEGGVASPGGGDEGARSGPVDLNLATQSDLEALPGIGPSLAQAIIAERERRGGFTDVAQLQSVRGIGERRFADLRPLVTV